jgi:hypothetical protein
MCGAEAPIASGRRRRPVRARLGLDEGHSLVNGKYRKLDGWTKAATKSEYRARLEKGEVAPSHALLRFDAAVEARTGQGKGPQAWPSAGGDSNYWLRPQLCAAKRSGAAGMPLWGAWKASRRRDAEARVGAWRTDGESLVGSGGTRVRLGTSDGSAERDVGDRVALAKVAHEPPRRERRGPVPMTRR